jgi:23S rRNA (guanosine2251-2'-O)-methyltransferase
MGMPEAPVNGERRCRSHYLWTTRIPRALSPRPLRDMSCAMRRPPRPRPQRPDFARRERPVGLGGVSEGAAILYGWHAVLEALRNPRRRMRKLYLTPNALRRLEEERVELPLTTEIVRPDALDARLGGDAVHQGLLLEAEPLPPVELESLPADGLLLVLDQITDPHNVGAILRTAAAFAVDAVVTTARHSPEATGVLAKSASGGLEHVPIAIVPNLARALAELSERGFWRIGLDSEAPATLAEAAFGGGTALVLGAEGKGLRQLTRQSCDALARLDMPGAIKSLNVSNACAIALYAATAARRRG